MTHETVRQVGAEPATVDDSALVAATLAGSQDAFRSLVERYQRPIMSLIQRLIGDPAAAEDLAQEAFIKAHRALARFDQQRKLSSWLFKIANNCAIDYLRRQRQVMVPLEAQSSDGDDSWEVLSTPDDQSPHRRAENAQLASVIDASIATLKPVYRQVLLLRFQHGMAYHEIADTTGVALGTVKIQLHRARKQLATELHRRGIEPPSAFAPGAGAKSSPRVSQAGHVTTAEHRP